MDPSTLVVLFGAGASFDCAIPASSAAHLPMQPPLAKDLFDGRFSAILNEHKGAEALAAEIRDSLKRETLEQILLRLQSETSPHIRRQFLQIPEYLVHLLTDVSDKYVRSGGHAYYRLVNDLFRAVPRRFRRVLFLSLNYDTFMEQAPRVIAEARFTGMDDYVDPDGTASKMGRQRPTLSKSI